MEHTTAITMTTTKNTCMRTLVIAFLFMGMKMAMETNILMGMAIIILEKVNMETITATAILVAWMELMPTQQKVSND